MFGSRVGIDTGVAVGRGAMVDSTAGTATAPQATAADIKIPNINEPKPRFMVASSPPIAILRVISNVANWPIGDAHTDLTPVILWLPIGCSDSLPRYGCRSLGKAHNPSDARLFPPIAK